MKLVVKYGDKALCLLVLLWVAVVISGSLNRMAGGSPIEAQVEKSIQKAKTSAPPVQLEEVVTKHVESVAASRQWSFVEGTGERSSIHFRRDEVDVNIFQAKYDESLKSHEHKMHDLEEGGKHCYFPGCLETELPPDVFLGAPTELKVDEVTVMTVKISWKGVKDARDAEVTHCVLQKKVPNDKGELVWADVLDENGEVLKIFPSSSSSEELSEEEGGFSVPTTGFQVPGGQASVASAETSKKPVDMEFHYFDYNLNPSTDYSYRAKAMGSSIRDQSVVEGLRWSSAIVAKTKEDQGIGFTRYIPGLRGKDGKLRTRSDGSYISPDKVYVRISKLFTPPWSPVRYFISYEHRNIIPGDSEKGAIGKLDRSYEVETADGSPVYIDRSKKNFLHVSEERTIEALKVELEENPKVWKPYKMQMDFSTPWIAKSVEEEIVEEVLVKTQFNAMGKEEKTEDVVKKYRYFLIAENPETKKDIRLELERDDLTTRLLRY